MLPDSKSSISSLTDFRVGIRFSIWVQIPIALIGREQHTPGQSGFVWNFRKELCRGRAGHPVLPRVVYLSSHFQLVFADVLNFEAVAAFAGFFVNCSLTSRRTFS